ncbi:hypothetical protein JQ594_28530 [Bradyrhizobium manausense]|nr:hypothetical protein [Bradyrhizobium manausense]MBR0689887.1 hypothetical protein [Bradyrhizobium manausense]
MMAIARTKSKSSRPAIQRLRCWAISVLYEADAIVQCEKHGWLLDRADPYARECAFAIARKCPPSGLSSEEGVVQIMDLLESIGDSCPECPPKKVEYAQ